MTNAVKLFAVGGMLLLAGPVLAADLAPADLGPVKVQGTMLNWSAGLEVSPEFYAISKAGKQTAGDYADTAIKASLGYTFLSTWTVAGYLQANLKNDNTEQYYGEGSIAYKFKWGNFSLTPSAGLGETWDQTGLGDDKDSAALYYALYLSGDLKVNQQWSWNIFNARWRNAFDYTWETPKIATGLSYAFSDTDKFGVSLGYSWKNTGDGNGYQGDKYNIALSMKHAF